MSLVEVMVAVALSVLLLAGVVQVFQGNRQSFQLEEAMSRVQETGRYAMQLMSRDLRMAGYFGCSGHDPKTVKNVLNNAQSYAYNFDNGIQGYDYDTGSWTPSLDPSLANLANPPAPNTDVITLRHAGSTGINVQPPRMPNPSATLQISTPNPLQQGDVVLVTDCKKGAIMQKTNQPGQQLTHNTGGATSPGNATQNLGHRFGSNATVLKAETITYFIARDPNNNNVLTLYRRTEDNAPQPVLPGVQNMQITYGVAPATAAGPPRPDRYVPADQVAPDWDRVLSARVQLLVHSVVPAGTDQPITYDWDGQTVTPQAGDYRLRKEFRFLTTLRNRAR